MTAAIRPSQELNDLAVDVSLSSVAVGDLLHRGADKWNNLPDAAVGNALLSGGVGVAPAYGKVGLTTHVSGVLPVANGGSGQAGMNPVFVQDTPPVVAAGAYMWVQTGLGVGGHDFTIWIEDNL